MKIAILVLTGLVTSPLFAMQVSLTCFARSYICTTRQNSGACAWQTQAPAYEAMLELVRDPNFPTTQFPYEVYRANYQTEIDSHNLTLDFFWSNHDELHPLKVYANLNARTVMAESSGTDQIDIALRNQNYGRGFICTNFQVAN